MSSPNDKDKSSIKDELKKSAEWRMMCKKNEAQFAPVIDLIALFRDMKVYTQPMKPPVSVIDGAFRQKLGPTTFVAPNMGMLSIDTNGFSSTNILRLNKCSESFNYSASYDLRKPSTKDMNIVDLTEYIYDFMVKKVENDAHPVIGHPHENARFLEEHKDDILKHVLTGACLPEEVTERVRTAQTPPKWLSKLKSLIYNT